MSENAENVEIPRGLKSIYVDRLRTCLIVGRVGELRYRGYSIHDLAQHSSLEETRYLLLDGELPVNAQLAASEVELRDYFPIDRRLSEEWGLCPGFSKI